MTTYYKVVNNVGLFKRRYDIQDIKSIPEGSVFIALEPDVKTNFVASDGEPMLYFARGAFDTMLWYPIFNNTSYYEALAGNIRESCIYEIIPLTPVIKDRSPADHNYFRCGANKIEFKKQISVNQIAKLALEEYEHNKLIKHFMYGRKFVQAQVEQWRKRYLK